MPLKMASLFVFFSRSFGKADPWLRGDALDYTKGITAYCVGAVFSDVVKPLQEIKNYKNFYYIIYKNK